MPTRRIYKFTLCLATPTPCEAMDGGFRCDREMRRVLVHGERELLARRVDDPVGPS